MHFTESLRRRDKLKIFHQKLNELSAASVRCGSTVRRYVRMQFGYRVIVGCKCKGDSWCCMRCNVIKELLLTGLLR